MKKRILSIFLLSVLLGSQMSTSVLATTPENIVRLERYENLNMKDIYIYRASGIVVFNHNGVKYTFDTRTDRVGYNQANKYSAVLFAQRAFNFTLGTSLALDGIFGQSTHSALEAYQRTRGLSVDCIIGPSTWDLLTDYK